ncbi:MAG: excinuclease ABC subunit UvrA [Patescibacteria group bacterium]
MSQDKIIIKGAREHNLKNISLTLPKNKMIVFTGVSGSGKSSLAFDTIFAEGQRRYIESLSAYARQFLGQKDKPDVDSIEGLSPAISIDQKGAHHNPRSTVATITEIYDYLRVLYARIGKPYCPNCGRPIEKMTVDEMIDVITEKSKGVKRVLILAPVVRGRKGEYHQLLYDLYMEGFTKARVNGEIKPLGERIVLARYKAHTIDAVIDEIEVANPLPQARITESVELALTKADGLVTVVFERSGKPEEITISSRFTCSFCNLSFVEIEPRLFSFNSPYGACSVCHGLGTEYFWTEDPCPGCDGARLRKEALSVRLGDKNVVEVTRLTIETAKKFFESLNLSERQLFIAERLLNEIANRLQFMMNVGIGYLTLERRAGTLSGGEAQRIRLASQVGSRLTGVLYVLDEPTIGLHSQDNERLVTTLLALRDLGNTMIVVEHDEDTVLAADYLVDIGPGAGRLGGEIVADGTVAEVIKKTDTSLTAAYLSHKKQIALPEHRRTARERSIDIIGATANNLKNIDVAIPLGILVCITGVSGSGKSSLIDDILYKALANRLNGASYKVGKHSRIEGLDEIDKIIIIDQSPIGRTPRSNPATYTGTFTPIRDLFTALPEARERGYRPGRFSFNVPGGRCEACEGDGYQKIEMHFLPDVYVPCEVCKGKRFSRETLEVKFKNKSIADVLDLTVDEAAELFSNIPQIGDKLKTLQDVGLGYIKLGQSATTLSGGEAQRVKLSTELSKRATGRTLYILDEPTVGLHYEDIKHLIAVVQRLVTHGNSVIVIEHNLEVIKNADWVIDLGPSGGVAGGKLVAQGTPEHIAKQKTATGEFLHKKLSRS